MAMAMNPIQVLRNGAEEEKAETARLSSFVGKCQNVVPAG